jgi:hypothetical protein
MTAPATVVLTVQYLNRWDAQPEPANPTVANGVLVDNENNQRVTHLPPYQHLIAGC